MCSAIAAVTKIENCRYLNNYFFFLCFTFFDKISRPLFVYSYTRAHVILFYSYRVPAVITTLLEAGIVLSIQSHTTRIP